MKLLSQGTFDSWVGCLTIMSHDDFIFPGHPSLNRANVKLVDLPKLSCNILVILLSL